MLEEHLSGGGWDVNTPKIQDAGSAVNFGSFGWQDDLCPRSCVTDKIQVYLSSKKVTGTRLCTVLGSGTFIPHQAQCARLMYLQVKKGALWDWVSEQQVTFEKHSATEADKSSGYLPGWATQVSVTLKCVG